MSADETVLDRRHYGPDDRPQPWSAAEAERIAAALTDRFPLHDGIIQTAPGPDIFASAAAGLARAAASPEVNAVAHPWDVLQSTAVSVAPAAPLAEVVKLLDSMQVLGRILYGELPPAMVAVLLAVLLERQRKAALQLARIEADLSKLDRLLASPLFDQVQQPEAAPAPSTAPSRSQLGDQLFDQLLSGALRLQALRPGGKGPA